MPLFVVASAADIHLIPITEIYIRATFTQK